MKSKRALSLTLVAMLAMSMLAGCGDKAKTTASSDSKSTAASKPSSNEKITIKYWVPFASNQYIKSLTESEMYKELEARTNVHVEFIHPTEGQELEQFNLLMTQKDLPDVIQTYSTNYKGGFDKAVADGAFIRLNELIDKNAPNFKKLRQEDPELARQTITDQGNITAFPVVGVDKNEPAWWGPVIRKDWLDELGLKEPTTIDEWYNMLTQFKVKKKAEAPLVFRKSGIDPYGTLVSAYGIGPSFYKKDDVVKYGPMEPEFKEYLATLNKWYKEGLIDKDFATRDKKSREALITSGKVGAYITEYALVDQYAAAIKTTEPKAEFAPLVQPSLKAGENVHYRVTNPRNGGYEAVITSSCKNPEAVVKWFDYAYSQEGFMLFNYGTEGKSYTMVDGKPKFTELLTKDPSGLDFWTVCNKYKLDIGPYLRDYKAIPAFTKIDSDCMDKWTKAEADYVIPPTNMTPEENDTYSSIMGDIDTYRDEMVLKFIIGKEPLSNFDKYVGQLKKMRVEEVIKIQQDALDRYNTRKIK
ncbi:extracellular solute-binding protein [Clostridium estertheticum]|uniref:extracellular solute-binding protein n=1 Tax=Clostridium estertheticum TaxID=238834 RepID=UPI0013E94535|nr:extracellular solute-binding protein [Clostridium estertheticum]MBZ9685626.1 extracellular solute-binding protein [Clostridium estertheticum]